MRDYLVAALEKPRLLRREASQQLPLPMAEPPAPATPHPDFIARAAIWRDQRTGLISIAEAQRRSAAAGQAVPSLTLSLRTPRQSAPNRSRHSRPAPNESRQYAPEMATTAARDDRLTPNAKAFLQLLRARCGKGRTTAFAKATLAAVMSRSTRTIRRYIADLEAFGYITTEVRRTGRGLHTGLVVTITDAVVPFYAETKGLAAWLAETPVALERPFEAVIAGFHRVTKLTPKNQPSKYHLLGMSFGWKTDRGRNPPHRSSPIPSRD